MGWRGSENIDREKYTYAAQLGVLQACPPALSRLLHRDDGPVGLVAAKIYVLSKLLLKSLSEKASIPLVDSLRLQLATLRPVLLQHIDSLLSSTTMSASMIINALTAFSVLKTSSPPEVLRHFLYVRSTAISSLLGGPGDTDGSAPSAEVITKSIILFNKTLVDAESIFPKKISRALVLLKNNSLLQDVDVIEVSELSLDVNALWLPEDIRGFIPWISHDNLEDPRVKEVVQAWAENELEKIRENLQRAVDAMNDVDSIVKLRGGVLALWRAGSRVCGNSLPDIDKKFRAIAMARVAEVIRSEAQGLENIADEIRRLLPTGKAKDGNDSISLWAEALLSLDLGHGATVFRDEVTNRVHGKSDIVREFLSTYSLWLSKISHTAITVRNLRTAGVVEVSFEEDFEFDEERAQEIIEDSDFAEKELINALDGGYRKLERTIASLVDEIQDCDDPTASIAITRKAIFLLRVTKQIRGFPPKRGEDTCGSSNIIVPTSTWFCMDIIPRLHQIVSKTVAQQPLQTMNESLLSLVWEDKVELKPLWEGTPILPIHPSPLIFRFLHDIVAAMSTAGEDVWTPAAVKSIKAFACDCIWKSLEEILKGRELLPANRTLNSSEPSPKSRQLINTPSQQQSKSPNLDLEINENPPTNNPPPPPPNTIKQKRISYDWTIQLLFDMLYLDEALHRKRRRGASGNASVTSLVVKVDSVIGHELDLDEELRIRLEGSASEYWKKTCMLFALLG